MERPVSVARMPPGQPLDLPAQGLLVSSTARAVSQDRTRQSQHAADPSLRDLVSLAQIVSSGPLLVGAHHFFFNDPTHS